MTGMWGWIGLSPPGRLPGELAVAPFGPTELETISGPGCAVTLAARDRGGNLYGAAGRIVAVQGLPRFADRELGALAERHGAARAIAQGYGRRGPDVFTSLSGTFSIAVLELDRRRAVLAADRIGVGSLFYRTIDGGLVFGSTLGALRQCSGTADQLRAQAVYEYLYFHMIPGPQTVYADCERVSPGTFVCWDDGAVRTSPYWRLTFVEDERRPFPELKERFVGLVRKSVTEAVDGRKAGAFLSGGTDSSTLTGVLRDVTGEAPSTYSIGFDVQGFDETSYARIAARHFGARHHEYYVTADDVVDAIPRIAASHDQPFGNSSAVPTYYCAKLAKEDGIQVLLGGDGGDELFGGNARYAKQYLYSLYSDLPAPLRKGVIEPLVFAVPETLGPVAKLQRYIRNASQPMPARYDHYNLLERLGPSNVFTAEFLASVDIKEPPSLVSQAYWATNAGSLINRMLALDLKYTLADNDLPKVVRSCELAGIEVRFPMLDDALVAFAARLAPRLKLKGSQLRYFFKKALQGFLPAEVIAKKKHGFGLPFGPWLQTHERLQQFAWDSLTDLKKRLIVRPEFIDELASRHLQRHADYFGTMVWLLIMLEQWFKQHHAPRKT